MTEAIEREGILWDGWAVVLVKRVRDDEPFAATWTPVLCPPAGSARWYMKRPRKVLPPDWGKRLPHRSGRPGIHYKLLPETYISNDEWTRRFIRCSSSLPVSSSEPGSTTPGSGPTSKTSPSRKQLFGQMYV